MNKPHRLPLTAIFPLCTHYPSKPFTASESAGHFIISAGERIRPKINDDFFIHPRPLPAKKLPELLTTLELLQRYTDTPLFYYRDTATAEKNFIKGTQRYYHQVNGYAWICCDFKKCGRLYSI